VVIRSSSPEEGQQNRHAAKVHEETCPELDIESIALMSDRGDEVTRFFSGQLLPSGKQQSETRGIQTSCRRKKHEVAPEQVDFTQSMLAEQDRTGAQLNVAPSSRSPIASREEGCRQMQSILSR